MSIGPILIRWKLFIGLSILLFVIASVTFNLNVITITGIVVINGYGAVTISRKLVQLSFARSYIRSSRYVTRQPLVLAASLLYPQHAKQIKKLLHSQDQWADFRKKFIASISISENSGKLAWKKIYAATYPEAAPVGIVVPTYKTKWTQLHRLVKDIANQSYPNIHVRIVLNSIDPDLEAFANELIKRYGNEKYRVLVEPNKGKRKAMRMGFDSLLEPELKCKYIFNIDSDSAPDEDAVANMVRIFENDPTIKCSTGDIRIENKHDNLLTLLTSQRYFYAFNVERAAQSYFYAVNCMSGPLMAVESEFLRSILHEWSNQTFLSRECTYGDDRHIATLTLKNGEGSAYAPDCICETEAPKTLKESIVQQTRWARSSWRETYITIPWMHKLPLWIILDAIYLTAFPFILLYGAPSLSSYLIKNKEALFNHLILVGLLTLLFNSVYGMFILKDWKFILFPFYTLYQTTMLLPSKIYALFTPYEVGWGTK